ncbi:MAG: leucine-rich repeat protein [Bacteroidaceae bacterium]|nr:leucine-rich repeat protein [Bacteroidaceae bacterium]
MKMKQTIKELMTSTAWGQSGASVRRAAITLIVMLLTATGAWADESGKCGERVEYHYNESTQTLTITGDGEMYDYNSGIRPWESYCNSITSIVFGGYVESIGRNAFLSCSSLKSVNIPSYVTSIGESAFYDCTSLTSVFITNPVGGEIHDLAFFGCTSLESVIILSEELDEYGFNAFPFDAKDLKIFVPGASVQTYQEEWSDYSNSITPIYNLDLGENISATADGVFVCRDGIFATPGTTFTLSHDRPGYFFLGYLTNGVAITDGTFTMPESNVSINAIWAAPDDISISDDGTEYTIKTATGWKVFCDMLESGESFSGKTVKLEADIGTAENPVRRMAGGKDYEFAGTFDGEGKTLFVNITGTVQGTAPFCEIKGATIKNLVVTGSVAGMRHSAGLVGFARGDDASVENTIENCLVATDVSITGDDRGYLGGIVGHGLQCTLTIRGCAFTGSLTSESNYTGGLQGWSDGNTLILTDDLFAPTSVSAANVGFHPIAFHLNNATTTATVSNVYYTVEPTCTTASRIATTSAAEQPKASLSVTAGENVSVEVSPVGDATKTYSVSGITAYAKGITYNDTFYYGSGDQMNLTLSHGDAPEGYAFIGYTASPAGATLTGITNPYTLTMPDSDVQIGAKYADSEPYIDENGEEQTCADYIFITSDMTTLGSEGEETWYVVNGDVTIYNDLEVKGDVHLILADDASLTSMYSFYDDNYYNGIDYLTIYGQDKGNGKLNITGGIGFNFSSSLTINGGEIDVDAQRHGFNIEGGSLTINSGKVDVKAQDTGISINTGSLTINGGEVDVEVQGNGILNDNGSLTINGGKVDVKGQDNGLFIYNGSLTINGGKVNVEAQYVVISINNGSLTINGGKVDVRAEHTGVLYALESAITFGWIRPEDHIYLDCPIYNLSGSTVGIASGQTLTNGTYTYTGSNINIYDLNVQTLFGVDVLNDASDNDIATLNGKNTNVLLSGRTLYKDGSWNTLCLPFDLTLSGSVLDGDNVELMTLGDASFSQGTLSLSFVDADEIEAGKPYIIRWDNTGSHIVNPVFKGVTIANASLDENAVTKNDVISFKGIYSPFEITEANNKLLYLGDDNQIYYPSAAMTINAFRAYFELQGDLVCGEPSSTDNGINAFVLNFGDETTSIEHLPLTIDHGTIDHSPLTIDHEADAWYSIDGRKLSGKPTAKGIYINNGKKFVIK